MTFDYLVVGAGLFGATFAREAANRGFKVKVIEKRSHIAGNIYTKEVEGIQVHEFGAHIFHTSDKRIWDYVHQFATFNRYTNTPVANFNGEIYNLPFNMNTFNKLWGVVTPQEAAAKIEEQRAVLKGKMPENLEEQAISLVGEDVYYKLIKGYTEKQWGRSATELPAFIIRRLPVRYTYDFFEKKEEYLQSGVKIIFTGMIDEFFNYELGTLEYRSLRFETEVLDVDNFQGNAVVNYTDRETPYTRIIEHKHFEFGAQEKTVITKEYPSDWEKGQEPYYPVNNQQNNDLYSQYKKLAQSVPQVIFGGRLGQYRYYDMHQVIAAALEVVKQEFNEK